LNLVTALKSTHVTCVATSYLLFTLRGWWRWRDSPMLRQAWVRVLPHVVDSGLLASAIALAWQLGVTPVNSRWLAAKIVALLFYIGFGMLAFRFGKAPAICFGAYGLAQLMFLYIVSVAVRHDPLLWF
jgi:uncharacterized membrane protein SirB2